MTSTVRRIRWTLFAIAAVAALTPALAGGDWNDAGITWQPYDKGVALAKEQKIPVCLVFYTEWCPHCTKYAAVFHDSRVVEKSKKFVMIRLDKDKNAELSKKYAPDGEYIPRTFFLKPDGTLDQEIHAPRDQFKYFYDEAQPGGVLTGMEAALKKLKPA